MMLCLMEATKFQAAFTAASLITRRQVHLCISPISHISHIFTHIDREQAVNSWCGYCMHSRHSVCHQSAESAHSTSTAVTASLATQEGKKHCALML